MSLIDFHRFLIAIAIVFCLGYGAWEIAGALRGGGGSSFLLGSVFLVLGAGLGLYLRRLARFLGYGERRREPR